MPKKKVAYRGVESPRGIGHGHIYVPRILYSGSANKGSIALNISTVALGGKWPNQYSQTNTCPTQLAPGASCTVSVTFEPNAKGSWPANVSITDDGGGSPQTVTLTGMGTN
ncbi:MAG: choice-of-anchor D domain-containing protein [Acidobacteriales bacterium]|nr:choice-of-anchor D domain-containing protein [Terriglobales bacterium]